MTTLLQLNPPIPVTTPKGDGRAIDDACARLRDRGVMHRVVLPPADLGVKDWNDWLRQLKRPADVERGAA